MRPKIFYLLQKAHSALFRSADMAIRHGYGLTLTQQSVLYVLMNRDAQAISEIAATLCMGKSSLTGLVDRMAADGLVERKASLEDGRSTLITLCDKGRAAAQSSLSTTRAVNDAILHDFSAEEQATIARFLTYVADNAASLIDTVATRDALYQKDQANDR